ncbi:hypothetical protein [Streptomyces clavuligerus]|uniref:hypothetical protein n=1 Tax=Streptomyces clavuligerus TaxID=1901 RepID=UPI001E34C282|nr:hypothetical protein [Streptomyces clavuligerus]
MHPVPEEAPVPAERHLLRGRVPGGVPGGVTGPAVRDQPEQHMERELLRRAGDDDDPRRPPRAREPPGRGEHGRQREHIPLRRRRDPGGERVAESGHHDAHGGEHRRVGEAERVSGGHGRHGARGTGGTGKTR